MDVLLRIVSEVLEPKPPTNKEKSFSGRMAPSLIQVHMISMQSSYSF